MREGECKRCEALTGAHSGRGRGLERVSRREPRHEGGSTKEKAKARPSILGTAVLTRMEALRPLLRDTGGNMDVQGGAVQAVEIELQEETQ